MSDYTDFYHGQGLPEGNRMSEKPRFGVLNSRNRCKCRQCQAEVPAGGPRLWDNEATENQINCLACARNKGYEGSGVHSRLDNYSGGSSGAKIDLSAVMAKLDSLEKGMAKLLASLSKNEPVNADDLDSLFAE